MGHIFILCGPPGAGKTTFLKEIERRDLPFEQLKRITTRSPRKEEGDKGKRTLEYEFLSPEEFAGRLSRGTAVNFIEWSGNFYATDISDLDRAIESENSFILFEDIPSAVALKERFREKVTVMLMFTGDKEEIDRIEFAYAINSNRPSIIEWRRRLGLKYDDSVRQKNLVPSEEDRQEYIRTKMARSIHDLAFIAGKFRKLYDIEVLANERDQMESTIRQFLDIAGPREPRMPRMFIGSSSEGLPVARKLQASLSGQFAVVIWNQGTVFGLGSQTLEALEEAVNEYEFGVFVFTPDDILPSRGEERYVPRDNVIFEFGLFTGKLGRKRAFIVKPSEGIDLPTNLAAVTAATYDSANTNLAAALEPACEMIRDAVRKLADETIQPA
jgi:predicted nucleotide-binding protein